VLWSGLGKNLKLIALFEQPFYGARERILKFLVALDAVDVLLVDARRNLRADHRKDAGVDEDGTHSISVNRECILPNQTLSFMLTLDTAMTKEIGITSIDQVLEILQQDFDATHELLMAKFTKVNPSVFKALEPANAFIGGNTGFIQKTVIMAAFTDDINKGVEVIRALLDVNFQKAGHDRKDKFMVRIIKNYF